MFKSITSKLVTVSATTALAIAIIASSASAINIVPAPIPCYPQSPRIALTAGGQVHGTCFNASTTALLMFGDANAGWDEDVTTSASGTFTTPFESDPYNRYLNDSVTLVVDEFNTYGSYWASNYLTVDLNVRPEPVF